MSKVRTERYAIPLLLLLLVVVLLVTTWGRFGDPFLDYGIALYGPFLVARGGVPIRDFEWLYGPLSLLWNGLLFALFGIHNSTLLIANAILLILFSAIIYYLFTIWFDRKIAAIVLIMFFLCFAFSHSTKVGNYNYLTPYSSEALHGLYLGVLLVALGTLIVACPSLPLIFLHGAVLALALLTKAEMAFAGVLAWLGTYFCGIGDGTQHRLRLRHLFLSCLGCIGTLACIFCLCLLVMPPSKALAFVAGAWRMLSTPAATVEWNKQTIGLDAPVKNLLRMLDSSLLVALTLGAVLVSGRLTERLQISQRATVAIAIGAIFTLGLILEHAHFWKFAAYSLPVVAAGLVCYYGWRAWRFGSLRTATEIGPFLWAVWSLGAILRMALNARVEQYGFVQAMPVVALAWAWCLHVFPRVVARRPQGALLVRACCLGLLLAFCASQFQQTLKFVSKKQTLWTSPTVSVRMYDRTTDPRIPIWQNAFSYLRGHLQQGDKLLVIPEGAFVAFALEWPMCTRTPQLTPTEVAGFGEANIVADFERQRADVIVIVHKHNQPFLFGRADGYGKEIMSWVRRHYRREILFGNEPNISETSFGIEILRRL